MVSHELRNPLSAIVQSSEVVLNSLRRMLAQEGLSSSAIHELSEDIETITSIGLCTMHMRRLIDDTINVCEFCVAAPTVGFKARERNASRHAGRLRTHDHCKADPADIRCRTAVQED